MPLNFITAPHSADFVQHAVSFLTERINKAIEDRGSCVIGLSGGSTPVAVYEALGIQELQWSHVHLFLIDERYVEPSSIDSNQRLIHETLLKNAKIPEKNIVFPDTALPLEECIEKYSADLKNQWSEYLPDIHILGMGDDGHIASLFPPLAHHLMDDSKLIHHTTTDRFAIHDRITLSLNAVVSAKDSLFLLKGLGKKGVWDEMMASQEGEERWPAKRVLKHGDVTVVFHQ